MEQAIRIISLVVYGGLAVASVTFARRTRTASGWWAAATFTVLGLAVVVTGVAPPPEDVRQASAAQQLYVDGIVILLALFPWLLHRFSRALSPGPRAVELAVAVGLVALSAWTLVLPPFPPPDAPQPAWAGTYTAMFFAWWAVLLVGVAVRLWRLGAGRPGVVRGRMRLMAVAAVLMTGALAVSILGGSAADPGGAGALLNAQLGWLSAAGFLLGLHPTPALRRIWRARDEADIRHAEAALLAADTPEGAAEAVVRAAARVLGGEDAVITDADGAVLARAGDPGTATGRSVRVEGRASTVTVAPSGLTPQLGHGEEGLLRQLCSQLDLALIGIRARGEVAAALAEAERANTDLQQLVYGVSHDLRNPLVTITGFLGLLQRQEELSDDSLMLIERMTASAAYMQGLVNDLLQLSRVGHADVERTDVPLGDVVTRVGDELRSRYADLSVDVATLPGVHMNEVRAQQLFANVIENAARYARPDGGAVNVRVDAELDGSWATVRVADDGQGIPPEQRDRVFEIFQRLGGFDATTEGSGIGLTMCRRIVEDVGGTIGIADAPVGTTVAITLPLADHGVTSTPQRKSSSA